MKERSMARNEHTKNKIEQTALELFAQKGYDAVSIRDIGKVVGIKESSIYYHFTNKQAIMESILARVDRQIAMMRHESAASYEKVEVLTQEMMNQMIFDLYDKYLLNPFIYRVIRMLSIERLSDKNADKVFQNLVFTQPVQQFNKMLSMMVDKKLLKSIDTECYAKMFYSVVYFTYEKYCLGVSYTPKAKELAKEELEKGIGTVFQLMSDKL
jgi:AcrR family transcriptional regulator